MFVQLTFLAAAVKVATAITFNTPSNVVAGENVTISWTSSSSDPSVFSIELVNAPLLGNEIAIANNVQTSAGSFMVSAVPTVPPANNYTIVAVDISNINNVLGTSGEFGVAAPASSTSSSAASTSSSASGSSTASGSASTTATGASSAASGASSATAGISSHFVSATNSAASAASSLTSGAQSSAASPSSSGSNFNAAPSTHSNMYFVGSCAVAVVGAVGVLAGFAL